MELWFLKSLDMRSCGEVGGVMKRGENAVHLNYLLELWKFFGVQNVAIFLSYSSQMKRITSPCKSYLI